MAQDEQLRRLLREFGSHPRSSVEGMQLCQQLRRSGEKMIDLAAAVQAYGEIIGEVPLSEAWDVALDNALQFEDPVEAWYAANEPLSLMVPLLVSDGANSPRVVLSAIKCLSVAEKIVPKKMRKRFQTVLKANLDFVLGTCTFDQMSQAAAMVYDGPTIIWFSSSLHLGEAIRYLFPPTYLEDFARARGLGRAHDPPLPREILNLHHYYFFGVGPIFRDLALSNDTRIHVPDSVATGLALKQSDKDFVPAKKRDPSGQKRQERYRELQKEYRAEMCDIIRSVVPCPTLNRNIYVGPQVKE